MFYIHTQSKSDERHRYRAHRVTFIFCAVCAVCAACCIWLVPFMARALCCASYYKTITMMVVVVVRQTSVFLSFDNVAGIFSRWLCYQFSVLLY